MLLAEGNSLGICLTVFALVLVTAVGFNEGGGFYHPTGAYIFFVVLFTGLLGVIVKAFTGEPVLHNVPNADDMLLVYLFGTCGMTAAAWLSNRLKPKKPFLAGRLTQENTGQVVIGCLVLGIALPYLMFWISPQLGTIARQLNITLPLAILVGVYQRTKATGGQSSFSWPVLIAWSYSTWFGLLAYSKEQIFAPSMAWLIAAAAARLRVTILQVLIWAPLGGLALLLLVPYSTYGRNLRDQTAINHSIAYDLLSHPFQLREQVNVALEERRDMYYFFDKPRGIFDRLTMLPIDAALVRRTDATEPIGIHNTFLYFQNIAPHFLMPNKPDLHPGNDYAHEIGMLGRDDHSTGISFSPYADAYHQAGWLGVLVLMPGVVFLMFMAMNLVVGSAESAPWALFFVSSFGHIAPEGLMLVPVYVLSVGMEAIVATAFVMIYVTPMLGTLLLGPSRRHAAALAAPTAIVGRVVPGTR